MAARSAGPMGHGAVALLFHIPRTAGNARTRSVSDGQASAVAHASSSRNTHHNSGQLLGPCLGGTGILACASHFGGPTEGRFAHRIRFESISRYQSMPRREHGVFLPVPPKIPAPAGMPVPPEPKSIAAPHAQCLCGCLWGCSWSVSAASASVNSPAWTPFNPRSISASFRNSRPVPLRTITSIQRS